MRMSTALDTSVELPSFAEHLVVRVVLQGFKEEDSMSRYMYWFVAALALGCASLATHAQSAPTKRYHLTLMQVPGNPPVPASVADINNRNEVVGSYVTPGSTRARTFIWRNGVFQDLTPLLGERLASPQLVHLV